MIEVLAIYLGLSGAGMFAGLFGYILSRYDNEPKEDQAWFARLTLLSPLWPLIAIGGLGILLGRGIGNLWRLGSEIIRFFVLAVHGGSEEI